MQDRTHITVKIPPALWEKLKRKRFEQDTTFQDVGLELFTAWADGSQGPQNPPEPERSPDPRIQDVEKILAEAPAPQVNLLLRVVDLILGRSRWLPTG
jgi:hypothetical protein